MRALIIDNGSRYTDRIPKLIQGDSFDIISYSELPARALNYDYYILSGGHLFPILKHPKELNSEIQLILDTAKPVLGICFGFELIAHTYGSTLKRRTTKQHGIKSVEIINPDPVFLGINNIEVYESHHWVVTKVGESLIPLAKSNGGYEIIRHREKLIYGFQFHPEMFPNTTQGDELFANWHHLISH